MPICMVVVPLSDDLSSGVHLTQWEVSNGQLQWTSCATWPEAGSRSGDEVGHFSSSLNDVRTESLRRGLTTDWLPSPHRIGEIRQNVSNEIYAGATRVE